MLHRSDQYCFYQNEKPVLFLHTGLHDDYHTPRDDVELINGSGMVKGPCSFRLHLERSG